MTKSKDVPLHIELHGKRGNMRLYIADCLYLDHYESTLILLRTRAASLRISGRAMKILLLEDGSLEIVGSILEVSFLGAT